MITKSMLRTDLPVLVEKDRYVNVVLALNKDSIYCESNLYLPKWMVSNVAYYLKNVDMFEGWIELEHINPPAKFNS